MADVQPRRTRNPSCALSENDGDIEAQDAEQTARQWQAEKQQLEHQLELIEAVRAREQDDSMQRRLGSGSRERVVVAA